MAHSQVRDDRTKEKHESYSDCAVAELMQCNSCHNFSPLSTETVECLRQVTLCRNEIYLTHSLQSSLIWLPGRCPQLLHFMVNGITEKRKGHMVKQEVREHRRIQSQFYKNLVWEINQSPSRTYLDSFWGINPSNLTKMHLVTPHKHTMITQDRHSVEQVSKLNTQKYIQRESKHRNI